MTTSWILVANASTAHLYRSPRAKLVNGAFCLSPIADYGHPESRKKGSDLKTDKCGHSGHGTFVVANDPRGVEAEHFAKQLADKLEEGRLDNEFQDLIVAAPPQFHGRLQKHLKHPLNNMVSVWIDKDYTRVANDHNLLTQLRNHL